MGPTYSLPLWSVNLFTPQQRAEYPMSDAPCSRSAQHSSACYRNRAGITGLIWSEQKPFRARATCGIAWTCGIACGIASSALAFILRLEPLHWLRTRAWCVIKIWGAEVLFLFSRISGLTVFLSFSFIEFLIQINKLNKIKTNKHKIKDRKAQNSTLTKYMQTTKKAKKNFKYSILEFGA